MKKNILIAGIVAMIAVLLFSPRSRKAIADTEALDKAYELKNVLSDWRKNNGYSENSVEN